MNKLNNRQLAAILVGGIGFGFAIAQEDCRFPYVQTVMPTALIAYVKADDSKQPSDFEKKLEGKGKL
ncbi:hypothetical protein ANSO36C_24690 [Nostoc cf. commune SO-36]|uniref:Uncharacterized protein n=1 Tax=Nostoc cf. commune SO-36 TaxID=449208 RepID=A0ABM7Z146_NOSCO|nr:hypothetical protein [Nostoc commune]BDI16667.1 hypothetical protein ANSO36C_24690 [Nostoc cf. commune SO-36]